MIKQVIDAVKVFFRQIYTNPADVIGIVQNNEGWE